MRGGIGGGETGTEDAFAGGVGISGRSGIELPDFFDSDLFRNLEQEML